MTNALRDSLARHAHAVGPPALDVSALVSAGEKRLRRRSLGAVAGSVLAVALAVGVPAVIWDLRDEPKSVEKPELPTKVKDPGTRPITYGQKQILHLGNREIDTGLDFLSAAVTDDGAALTTIDGGIWFTDGRTVDRIGSTIAPRVGPRSVSWLAGRARDWVVTDTAGSLLAWLEYPDQRPEHPELVVYDSGSRVVLDRNPIEVPDAGSASVVAIAGRAVFLAVDGSGGSLLRYDVDTGLLDSVNEADMAAARRGVGRALVVGSSAKSGGLLHRGGPHHPRDSVGSLTVNNSELDELVDPHTGEQVTLRVPAGYESGQMSFVQWLDDTRFTLISWIPGRDGSRAGETPVGDLLVCRIPERRCDVRLDRSNWSTLWTAPLLPGQGLSVGADVAMSRATQKALDQQNGG